MKKKLNFKNLIGKKNTLLVVVALVLVILTAVGATYSWIEQIANVEMKIGGGEGTPMHIGSKQLNAEAKGEISSSETTIDLSRYFYESGNMHLSSCYGDGNEFYFPKDNTNVNADEITDFRLGTKDDANVNYISITFPLTNTSEDYEQAFWFDGNTVFFDNSGSGEDKTALNSLIRCSLTVDSKTTIYSASSSNTVAATYKTVDHYSSSNEAVSQKNCNSFAGYTYYSSHNDPRVSGASNVNMKSKSLTGKKYDEYNANTLFVLKPSEKVNVTVKIWLECDEDEGVIRPHSVDAGEINMKLVSSFAKKKKVYFVDSSLYNSSATPASPWITNGHNLTLATIEKFGENNKYKIKETLTPNSNSVNNKFEFEIPSYYKGLPVIFLMSGSSEGVTYNGVEVYENNETDRLQAFHWWATSLPDTYEDSYFTEFTPAYGTWSDTVYRYYFVDSLNWQNNACAYMWNSNIIDDGNQVVTNKTYPGEYMYQATGYTSSDNDQDIKNGVIKFKNSDNSTENRRINAVYFDEAYSDVIFSDGNNFGGEVEKTRIMEISSNVFTTTASTYGIHITSANVYFDITANRWVTDVNNICRNKSNYLNYSKAGSSGSEGDDTYSSYYYSDSNHNTYFAARTLRTAYGDYSGDKYFFQVKNYPNGPYYKYGSNTTSYSYETYSSSASGTVIGLTSGGDPNWIKLRDNMSTEVVSKTGIYTFKFVPGTTSLTVYYP